MSDPWNTIEDTAAMPPPRRPAAKSFAESRYRSIDFSDSRLPTPRNASKGLRTGAPSSRRKWRRADSIRIESPHPYARECCCAKARSICTNSSDPDYASFSNHSSKQELASNLLSEELERLRREKLRCCSYVNSYSINSELDRIRGLRKERGYSVQSESETMARSISALVRLHLKRLNVQVKDGRDMGSVDLYEIGRQRDATKADLSELRRDSICLRQEHNKSKVRKCSESLETAEASVKQFMRKQLKANQVVLARRLRKGRLRRAQQVQVGGNENVPAKKESWLNQLGMRCEKQMALNQSIDSM